MSYIEAYSEPGPVISANGNSQSVITFNGVHRAFVEVTGIGPKGDKGDQGDPGEQGPQGEPGIPGELATADFVFDEPLTGTINGINVTYTTTSEFETGTTAVYINGVRQRKGAGNDYIEQDNDTIIFSFPIWVGAALTIDYIKL